MAKKEKRSRSRGSGAIAAVARNGHAAKQAAARRQIPQKSTKRCWIHTNMLTIALVSFIVLTIGLMFMTKMMMMSSDNGEGSTDGNDVTDVTDVTIVANGQKLIPPIDGAAMEVNDERRNKTLDFLNNFVCHFPPSITTTSAYEIDVGEKGYCHPRLSAVPHHRTQRVSVLRDDSVIDDTPADTTPTAPTAPTLIYQTFKKWGKEILRDYFNVTDESSETILDHGIPKGELIMRLPRPLQVWDLDALRDKYIQQHFLGFLDGSEDDEMEGMEEGSISTVPETVSARHKHTQNPLDSGAFLAVHLIRLVHGARARARAEKKGGDNVGREEDGRCQDQSGECKSLRQQRWDDYEPREIKRIDTLAPYLDILPTSAHRTKKSTDAEINSQGHPLFWSSRLLQTVFPPNTYTFDLIKRYQAMAESEYEALKFASEEFGENVGYLSYLNMRANVLSRAFGVPVAASSSSDGDYDGGAFWGASEDDDGAKVAELSEEMRSYETSNFGSFLDDDDGKTAAAEEFKLRSMCPLLDMYNSHPNPNVSWRYDPQTSSFVVRAMPKSNIPPGHSIVVSYGKYTDGHMFAKYGYVNGDGSSMTEISLAVFHRLLGDVGLGRQYSQLPFKAWDPNSRKDLFDSPEDEHDERVEFDSRKSLSSAKVALEIQAKELVRYLMFDDGYDDCIDVSVNSHSSDEELKLLKLQHLIKLANYRDAWIVRVPPQFPNAEPLQQILEGPSSSSSSAAQSKKDKNEPEKAVGINASRIVSICRLLSLLPDDVGGDAIEYLRKGLISNSESSSNTHFLVERAGDALEYRAMMCVVRLCNVGLSRYVGYDNAEPEAVGGMAWNAWYVTKGEVRALGMLLQTAASEANKYKRRHSSSKKGRATTISDAAMKVREEGACPLNYTLPLLDRL